MGLKPIRPRHAGESEADYARYLYRADRHGAGLSVAEIATLLGREISAVRHQVDPVYRWDRNRKKRQLALLRTPEERRIDSLKSTANKQRKREVQ